MLPGQITLSPNWTAQAQTLQQNEDPRQSLFPYLEHFCTRASVTCLCLDVKEDEKASFLGYFLRRLNLLVWNSPSEKESSKYARKPENITQSNRYLYVLFLPFGNLSFKILRWLSLKIKTEVQYHLLRRVLLNNPT